MDKQKSDTQCNNNTYKDNNFKKLSQALKNNILRRKSAKKNDETSQNSKSQNNNS